MNLTSLHPETRGVVENKSNSPVNIRFVAKILDIRNVKHVRPGCVRTPSV